jgi:Holliday junction DNA helicase RuvA
MIAFLRGRVLEKQPNRVLVDVNGVGYEVFMPLSTFYEVGEEGADIALRIHTHVREDALQLFGFLTALERQMFERLLTVSGIGPKLAIAVLSGLETRDLVAAVQRADIVRLTTIPGVGKKTAERIVLELKDRLTELSVPPPADGGRPAPVEADRVRDDLMSALQNLGYHRPDAERAADAVLRETPDRSLESALKDALRHLMRS